MRILWLDGSNTPWKEADGWELLTAYQIEVVHSASVDDAREDLLSKGPFDIFVGGVEVEGGVGFLTEVRATPEHQGLSIILISSIWGKKEFREHSASPSAADNYARLPIPASGFIDVLCTLRGLNRGDLATAPPPVAPASPPGSPFRPIPGSGGDDPSLMLAQTASIVMTEIPGGDAPPPAPPIPSGLPPAPSEGMSPMDVLRASQAGDESVPELGQSPTTAPGAAGLEFGAGGEEAPWRKEDPLPIATPISGAGELTDAISVLDPVKPGSKDEIQTLRSYLRMREEELQQILRDKRNLISMHEKLNTDVNSLQKKIHDLNHMRTESDEKATNLEKNMSDQERAMTGQAEQAEFEKESLVDRVSYLEGELGQSKERYGKLKQRVRKDIRQIQSREKELETRLELIKQDSETLIRERDRQVIDLKRKIDALEFDLDLIQDRKVQAETDTNHYVDKISKVARTLQLAFGMLEEEKDDDDTNDEIEPLLGGAAAAEELAVPDEAAAVDQVAQDLLTRPAGELNTQEMAAAEASIRVIQPEDLLAAGEEADDGSPDKLDEASETAPEDDIRPSNGLIKTH